MSEYMTYAGSAGVNYESMDPHKLNSLAEGKKTNHWAERFGFEVLPWSRGESSTVVKTPWGGYIAFVVEGLGTKNQIADTLRINAEHSSFYNNVARCNVAMAVNDLITSGAMPVMYNQYLALSDSKWVEDKWRSRDLIFGTSWGCDLARCVWGGGETPTLRGTIVPGTVDLAGAAWGYIPDESRLINPENIQAGDSIVFIESSGIHANGLSIARKIAEKIAIEFESPWRKAVRHFKSNFPIAVESLRNAYRTKLPDGRSYGETLLNPTHIYVGLVEDCFKVGVKIHYAVNITGHGWRKLMRAIQPLTYTIDTLPTQLPIFDFIQEQGPVSDEEAYGNLNMGAGFALYVAPSDTEKIIDVAKTLGFKAFVAGSIEAGEKQVIIKPKNLVYKGDTLKVR